MTTRDNEFILTLSCADTPGIVHAVSGVLAAAGCNIVDSQQFGDVSTERSTGLFFMRVHFDTPAYLRSVGELEALFAGVRERFRMSARVHAVAVRPRVMLLVSKHGHCLNDLLFRWHSGQLKVDICGVVSNHPDFESLVTGFGLPFHHLPLVAGASAEAKRAQEMQIEQLLEAERVDLVVLARYMQILSPEFCDLPARPRDQHPPQLPAELPRRAPLRAGASARRQADRGYRPLRDRRARRGSDHRAGRRARSPRHDAG